MAFDRSIPVLVVDDYDRMIRILRDLLRQVGFKDIDEAADGSTALTKMRDKKYGLVISEWSTERAGQELLMEMRADPGLAQTPFIMVTPETRTENVIAAKRVGVSSYLLKPFNARTLQNTIQAVLGQDAAQRRAAAA
jgi:two-component system chemotaxis response regulator CheY